MPVIKSLSVGNGDMFYILHGSDNFTMIDCNLKSENKDEIIGELKEVGSKKGMRRFICTHPDEDHFRGIHHLDEAFPVNNFYCVKNKAIKDQLTDSFLHYCKLRDGDQAYYLEKGSKRKWLNLADEVRGGAGLQVLWPDTSNADYVEALRLCDAGESFNNTSTVIRYSLEGGASFLWLGDLETEFMESIFEHIELEKTTIVFASHHGRASGKIPDSWLEKLDPQVIVIGEAPSRYLHYYTGYEILTQNSTGHITMECAGDKVHFYVTEEGYERDFLEDLGANSYTGYIGSITVETEYTLEPGR